MLNLDDIIWAAMTFRDTTVIPGASSYNKAYLNIIGSARFLEALRFFPQELTVADVRDIFVDFLNKWGCRLRNYDNVTATNLKNCIVGIHPELSRIRDCSILDFDFDVTQNREKIEHVFNKFWFYGSEIAKNYGPTCASKTLHIINPNLFVMWDDAIRLHYWIRNNEIIDSGRGYCFFLVETKIIARRLVEECRERFNVANLASWLSERLNLNPPHSLVKFIDEFNWLAYKRRLIRPPDWVCTF